MKADLSFELTTAVLATADTFLRESSRLFRPHGLTGAQFNVLNILAGWPAGISQRELGDLLVVDRSNVTGLLDRMEKAGWARRTDDPADRRVYRVLLTAAGQAQREKVYPRYLEVIAEVTAGLSQKRMSECIEALTQLKKNAATWNLPATKS
jgi:DNA-binding MarR family transcriptional regulator